MANEEMELGEISVEIMWICGHCPALFHEQEHLEVHDKQSHQYTCKCCTDSHFSNKQEFIDHFFGFHFYRPSRSVSDIAIQCNLESENKPSTDSVLFSCVSCMLHFSDFSAFQLHFNDVHNESTKNIAFQCKCNIVFDNFVKFCEHFQQELMNDKGSQSIAHGGSLYIPENPSTDQRVMTVVGEPEDVFATPDLHLDMEPVRKRPCSVKQELPSDDETLKSIKPPASTSIRKSARIGKKKVTYGAMEGLKLKVQPTRRRASYVINPDSSLIDTGIGEGETRFCCLICDAVLGSSDRLTVHINRQHKPHKCGFCGFIGSSAQYLGYHIMEDHLYADRKVKCWHCEETFVSHRLIRRHSEEKHSSNYKCAQCNKGFSSAEFRRTHVAKQHPEVITCDVCFFKPGNTFKLNEHYLRVHNQHIDTLQLKCADCPRIFARQQMLDDHRCIMHKQLIACEFCELTFTSRLRHKAHASKHSLSYKCRLCAFACPSEKTLAIHIGENHSDVNRIPEKFEVSEDCVTIEPVLKFMPFRCEFCNFSTDCKESHLLHKLKHSKADPRAGNSQSKTRNCCIPTCGRRSLKTKVNREFFEIPKEPTRRAEWVRAIIEEHSDFFVRSNHVVCDFHFSKDHLVACDDKFELVNGALPTILTKWETPKRVRQYIPRSHGTGGKWKRVLTSEETAGKNSDEIERLERSCPFCDQFFTRSVSLNHHVRLVHNSEDFQLEIVKDERVCEICAESVSVSTYKLHLDKHNKGRTEVCPKCGSAFHTTSQLRMHMSTGRCGTAVLVCSFCGKEFGSRSGLHYHVQKEHENTDRHYQKVACSTCNSVLTSTAALHRHIKEVHLDKKSKKACPHCSKMLNRKLALEDHINAFHTRQWSLVCNKCNSHFSQKRQAFRHNLVSHGLRGNEKNMAQLFTKVPWMDTNRNKRNSN